MPGHWPPGTDCQGQILFAECSQQEQESTKVCIRMNLTLTVVDEVSTADLHDLCWSVPNQD